MKGNQTIFRHGEKLDANYTTIANACLNGLRLTLATRGFLVSILSLPPDWTFHRAWARKEFDIGRDKLEAIIKELRDAGFVKVDRDHHDDGTLADAIYLFTDTPGVFHLTPENTGLGSETCSRLCPAQGQTAPTNYLDKDLEKTYSADAGSETRTSASVALGSPEAGEGKESGALAAQRPKEVATGVADAAAAEAMRKRFGAELKDIGRKMRAKSTAPIPGTGREMAGRRAAVKDPRQIELEDAIRQAPARAAR